MTLPVIDSAEAFEREVLQAGHPVLVDFTAAWCGPCKMLKPIVEELATEWAGRVKVVQVDVDRAPEIAMKYRILGVPTLMAFVNGEARERLTGYKPKRKIIKKFAKTLGVETCPPRRVAGHRRGCAGPAGRA